MSRVQRRDNYRVVIYPRSPGNLGGVHVPERWMVKNEAERQRYYVQECERIRTEARRHVDEYNYVTVEWDTESYCEHCGYQWTEKNPEYNGGCCEADEENNPNPPEEEE